MTPADPSPCDEFRAQLPLHVGGDLEAPLAEQVLAHLEAEQGCPSCARALEEFQRTRAMLLELEQRSPAPRVDVWPQVRQDLATAGLISVDRRGERGRVSRPAGRLLSWRRLASAAAAVALLALGLQLVRQQGDLGPERGPGEGVGQQPSIGSGLAEQGPVVVPVQGASPVAAPGGLRRLAADEAPLHTEALPFWDWQRGWPGQRSLPGLPAGSVDPTRPTFASDRSLR